MSDELTPQAGAETGSDEQASSGDKTAKELERARKEAANYRTQLREMEGKWKEAEPVLAKFREQEEAQKTEAQKLAEQLQALTAQLAEKDAAAQRAQRETQLTRLATKAGVDLDLVPYLDLSKLDLDDEKAALEVLGKLAAARQTASSASNPSRGNATGISDSELRSLYFEGGRNKPTIFGG